MQDQATAVTSTAEHTVPTNTIDELRAQASTYRLLARFLEQEIDSDLLHLLRTELREPLARVGIALDDWLLDDPEESTLETLAEEYTGLFVAPGGVSPYLSVFETGCMFREPCDRVVEAYHTAGWDYQRQYSGEFPDHIGTMLGFVGILFDAQADALEKAARSEAEQIAAQRADFIRTQVAPWAPRWCQRAAEAALQPLYRQILELTGQLLWTDIIGLVDRRQLREIQEANRREPKKLDYNADFRKASGI